MRSSHAYSVRPLPICVSILLMMCWLTPAIAHAADEHPATASTGTTKLPVFPGARGFGTDTRAGRGGRVIAVTSLANDGPGSLRAALNEAGPRIIVFKVGGVITLRDKLYVREPFITVAGQTAPGGGITLRDFGLVIVTNDVLIQHLRVRPGNQGDIDASANDAIEVLGNRENEDVTGGYNVVLDHISASWAEDEVLSTWFGAHDVTVSWSVISEGLNHSRHDKGDHSSGMVIGGHSERISVHHTLFAHNHSRNPLYKWGGTHEFTDNVVYGWGALSTDILEGQPIARINILRNTYLPGPATYLTQEMLIEPSDDEGAPQLYVEGNLGPNISDPRNAPWDGMFFKFSMQRAPRHYRAARAFATPLAVSSERADAAAVLRAAGASLPQRDAIDARVVADVEQQRGKIIDSPAQVGGYAKIANGEAALDGDEDGMPDTWESSVSLNPQDSSDGKQDRNGDGYTNVEEYLHSLQP